MTPRTHAMRIGMSRGWTEFVHGVRNPADAGFYVVMTLALIGSLWLNREVRIPDTPFTLPTLAMPSVVGGLVAFLAMIGVAYALAIEREDGTLLRAKAIPHGMVGYLTGQVTRSSAETVFGLSLVLIPGLLLFDNLASNGILSWLGMLWVVALGLLAMLPLGAIIGSLVRGARGVGTWAMMPFSALVAISGIFYPITAMPEWVQVIGQAFPLYWLGLGMRAAFLPDSAVLAEIGESWRQLETVAVLGGWAIAGLLIAPVVLRTMARRESGSKVEEYRQQMLQRVG